MSSTSFLHIPVLLDEVKQVFATVPKGSYADFTLGGAGHAQAVLEEHPDLKVLGVDRDEVALNSARQRLKGYEGRFELFQQDMKGILESWVGDAARVESLSALFADLGVSSYHFDAPERGFSFASHQVLDMRMDQRSQVSAYDVINYYQENRLVEVLREGGDVAFAGRIARTIVKRRPITHTDVLAKLVYDATPVKARKRHIHPATTVFQAIRIEVNGEFTQLDALLKLGPQLLRPKGVFAVISYHSGEDRRVKAAFNRAVSGKCACPPTLPCVCGSRPWAEFVIKKPMTPSLEEINRNPRSRSAKLRAIKKIDRGSEEKNG